MILRGLRVLELASGIAGPYAGLRLGDLGADIIKAEIGEGDWAREAEPKLGDNCSAMFAWLNRGKRSIRLEGEVKDWKGTFEQLLRASDIVVVDWSSALLETLDAQWIVTDPDSFQKGLIVVRVTPYGERGPFEARANSELVLQAMAGYTRYLGSKDDTPCRLGADVAGTGAGIFAVQAVLAALYHKMRKNEGQVIAVSELGSLLSMKTVHLAAQSDPDVWGGPRLGGANDAPEYGWRTADKPITFSFGGSVGAEGRPGWTNFVEEIGLENLLSDSRFDRNGRNTTGLGKNARALKNEYEARFMKLPARDIIDRVRKHGGIGAVYNDFDTLTDDQQLKEVGFISKNSAGVSATRFPGTFSDLQVQLNGQVPELGQHTDEILREIIKPTQS